MLAFNAEFERPGRCTDLRVKTAAWLELTEGCGATVIYRQVTAQDLDVSTTDGGFDPAIVAARRDDPTNVFDTDPARTVHDRPRGLLPPPTCRTCDRTRTGRIPTSGSIGCPASATCSWFPALSLSGHCHALASATWFAVGPAHTSGPLTRPGPAELFHRCPDLRSGQCAMRIEAQRGTRIRHNQWVEARRSRVVGHPAPLVNLLQSPWRDYH